MAVATAEKAEWGPGLSREGMVCATSSKKELCVGQHPYHNFMSGKEYQVVSASYYHCCCTAAVVKVQAQSNPGKPESDCISQNLGNDSPSSSKGLFLEILW